MKAVVITDEARAVEAERRDDRLLIAADDLEAATGWKFEEGEGLCRGDMCVPVPDRNALVDGDLVDLGALGEALHHPTVVDAAEGVAAMTEPASDRAAGLRSLVAPEITLPDLDGNPVSLADSAGQKRLVVAWASWCGCRHDLPGWQAVYEELAPHGFTMFGIAVDESPDHARPWVEEAGCTFPIAYDRDRTAVEVLGIVNVPTVVWVDEDDRIVRPHDAQFPDDNLLAFHGKPAAPHLEALRRWVVEGEAPLSEEEVREASRLPTDEEQLARAHYRIGVQLLRDGREEAAARHFEAAGELAPDDWTIRRAALFLMGKDPFLSDEFIAMYEAWNNSGRPGYKLA